MKHFLLLLALAVASLAAPEKWATAIAAFAKADAAKPPPRDAVLFIGSSSIVMWKSLARDFPAVPTINRGFGGSELSDTVFYLDHIALPYHPRIIVVYAGENDLWYGKTADQVAADFEAGCNKIHAALPATRIIFIGIKLGPARWKIHERSEQANALIAAYCARDPRRTFLNVWPAMLDAHGRPRPELFVADGVHMSPAGYAIWTRLLTPLLQ